ncbi:hypothetical protein JCM21900_006441 [Sporobolomyces salmonicolor]
MATPVPSATPVSHQDILSSPSSHAGPAAQPVIEVSVQEPGPTLDPPVVEKGESAEGETDIEKIRTGLGGMILQAPFVTLEKMSHTVANQPPALDTTMSTLETAGAAIGSAAAATAAAAAAQASHAVSVG